MVLWKLVDWPITIPWFSTDISLLEWRYGHLPIYTYIYIHICIHIYNYYIYIYSDFWLWHCKVIQANRAYHLDPKPWKAGSERSCLSSFQRDTVFESLENQTTGRHRKTMSNRWKVHCIHLSPFITIYHHLSPFILANIGELVPFYEQLCRLCRRRLIMGTLAMFFGCPLWTSEASSLSIWNPLGATFFSSRLQHTRWCPLQL